MCRVGTNADVSCFWIIGCIWVSAAADFGPSGVLERCASSSKGAYYPFIRTASFVFLHPLSYSHTSIPLQSPDSNKSNQKLSSPSTPSSTTPKSTLTSPSSPPSSPVFNPYPRPPHPPSFSSRLFPPYYPPIFLRCRVSLTRMSSRLMSLEGEGRRRGWVEGRMRRVGWRLSGGGWDLTGRFGCCLVQERRVRLFTFIQFRSATLAATSLLRTYIAPSYYELHSAFLCFYAYCC